MRKVPTRQQKLELSESSRAYYEQYKLTGDVAYVFKIYYSLEWVVGYFSNRIDLKEDKEDYESDCKIRFVWDIEKYDGSRNLVLFFMWFCRKVFTEQLGKNNALGSICYSRKKKEGRLHENVGDAENIWRAENLEPVREIEFDLESDFKSCLSKGEAKALDESLGANNKCIPTGKLSSSKSRFMKSGKSYKDWMEYHDCMLNVQRKARVYFDRPFVKEPVGV